MDTLPQVSASLDRMGRWVAHHPKLWIKLGNMESALLSMDIESINVRAPVYIAGLARSGSTLLLEILASGDNIAAHRHSDFPFLFTPYWWNTLLKYNPMRDKSLRERAHGDGMMITPDSPEAMEEMLWMAFFHNLHVTDHDVVLDRISDPEFEKFYRQHLQKLLLVRKAKRYVTKNNYNVTRMAYLQKIFPDARFIVPVRDPVTHIASLMRQHARFSEAGRRDPRVAAHMSLAGHFEFGLNRTPIHTGDDPRLQAILAAWDRGEEAYGWALYWNMLYRFIHEQMENLPALAGKTLFVRFETLCDNPRDTLAGLLEHTQMTDNGIALDAWAAKISTPDYYTHDLPDSDIALIRDVTGETAALYGY